MLNKFYDNQHDDDDDDDDDNDNDGDNASINNSPPSGLITLSPNTPILHFNPFGYV